MKWGCRAGNILRTQANKRAICPDFRHFLRHADCNGVAYGAGLARRYVARVLPGGDDIGAFSQPPGTLHRVHLRVCLVSGWLHFSVGTGFRLGLPSARTEKRKFRHGDQNLLSHPDDLPDPHGPACSGNSGCLLRRHRAVHPWQTFIYGALLWNQVGFDRILPMYCVFLAFSPIVLQQFTEGRAWLIGGISAGLWAGAQFGLGDARSIAAGLDREGFNLCAWQAYFVAGQYIGYRVAGARAASVAKSRILLVACVVGSVLLMVDRHLLTLWGINPIFRFDGHPNHNPVRFLDAACLAYLVWWIPRSVDLAAMKLRFFRFLNLLGGHSLQVFAFSLLVTRFEANLLKTSSPRLQLFVAILTVLSLGLPALLHQFFRQQSSASTPPRAACAPKTVTV